MGGTGGQGRGREHTQGCIHGGAGPRTPQVVQSMRASYIHETCMALLSLGFLPQELSLRHDRKKRGRVALISFHLTEARRSVCGPMGKSTHRAECGFAAQCARAALTLVWCAALAYLLCPPRPGRAGAALQGARVATREVLAAAAEPRGQHRQVGLDSTT